MAYNPIGSAATLLAVACLVAVLEIFTSWHLAERRHLRLALAGALATAATVWEAERNPDLVWRHATIFGPEWDCNNHGRGRLVCFRRAAGDP